MNYTKVTALLLALLLLMCACGSPQETESDSVSFYYIRKEIDLDAAESVIATETQPADGRSSDLEYMLERYLQGPRSDNLKAPFPDDLTLVKVRRNPEYLEIIMNSRLSSLTGMELTLACGCIAKTCMALINVQEVRISSQDRTLNGASYIRITADSLLYSGLS